MAPKFMGIAFRYFISKEDKEDVLQEAFILIFQNIHTFKGDSKIETWSTRILINCILQRIQKNQKVNFTDISESDTELISENFNTESNLLYEELIKLINLLPESKKVIFNLYVIEGYSHKEIADMLHISVSTSKTQLFRAKEFLMDLHKKRNKIES